MGDLNADISDDKSLFGWHLMQFCHDSKLVLSSKKFLPVDSFTYISEAWHTTSWLDHVIFRADAHDSLEKFEFLYGLTATDHLPVSMVVNVDHLPDYSSPTEYGANRVKVDWAKLSREDVSYYCGRTDVLLREKQLPMDAILCSNINCDDVKHLTDLCEMYNRIQAWCPFSWDGSADTVLAARLQLAPVIPTSLRLANLPGFCMPSALERMSASGLPSLWRLWTILGCAAAIHRRSLGSWLMANTDTPGYSTVISVPLLSSHHISTPAQLQLPHRPRYIHRGSGRQFVLAKHGDHGNCHQSITSLWSAGCTVAQQWRHQNTATPVAKDRSGNLKNIDSTSLSQHLQLLSPSSNTSLTDLMDYYNHNLHSILDFHAPLKTRTVTFIRSAPWFTEELRLLKRTGRVLERAYVTSGLIVHKLADWEHRQRYAKELSKARSAHYSNIINNNPGNSKQLFTTVKHLL
ncbi:uncharacterized protein LOC114150994 [Xyrichtys novacula]|uniref:Uncharacterized protein LOC114150994 n=1 Tax=Xyrichtys novacula TaxID=13765 RepID=A0AAV1EQD9_XYRNO|nr:uncharacterized protein LOC114150994 [Xyrichtys novacula]